MTWEKRGAVFEKSYDEVLAALKHQDDKLNRTLTAIAFLTAAGVAIYAQLAPRVAPVRFSESGLDATTVFFVIFLVAVLFALLVALSAIGPSDALPPRGKRERTKEDWPSLLYWAEIIKPEHSWGERIERKAAWLDESLARNFHAEAELIARRVDYKVARSRESGAFVQVAVLSLALLGVFSIENVSLDARWKIAAGVLVAVLLLPLWDFAQMRKYKFSQRAAWGKYAVVASVGVWAGALLWTADRFDTHWWAAFYALLAILATRLAYVNRAMAATFLSIEAAAGVAVPLLAWIF